MNILPINLVMSTVVFTITARIYLLPRLHDLVPRDVLVPILLFHAMRHLGLMFLAPGAVYDGLPPAFAYPAALGDLATAVLALIALSSVLANSSIARPLVGLFNVVGTLDLFDATATAVINNAPPFMGAAYWIPALWVPALLVTHYIVFVLLGRRWLGPI